MSEHNDNPQVEGFFDPATWTVSYVVHQGPGSACAIIDPVLDYDPKLQVLAAGMAQEPPPAPVLAHDNTVTPVRSAPHEPLSKMLMAHFHSMWNASARVVDQAQVSGADKNLLPSQEVVHKQAQNRNLDPAAVPGTLAKSVLTYSPSKIKKIDAA